jgi:hypothetical protein
VALNAESGENLWHDLPALAKMTSSRLSVYRRIPSDYPKFWTSDGVFGRNFCPYRSPQFPLWDVRVLSHDRKLDRKIPGWEVPE